MLSISPTDYHERDNGKEMRDFDMGMIMINLTNPVQEVGMASSPAIWSRPMPLGKCHYFNVTRSIHSYCRKIHQFFKYDGFSFI